MSIKAYRPIGYPDNWYVRQRRGYQERAAKYTVLHDPSGLFRKGAQFNAYEVKSSTSGMLAQDCFVEGTILLDRDGKQVIVKEKKLHELP